VTSFSESVSRAEDRSRTCRNNYVTDRSLIDVATIGSSLCCRSSDVKVWGRSGMRSRIHADRMGIWQSPRLACPEWPWIVDFTRVAWGEVYRGYWPTISPQHRGSRHPPSSLPQGPSTA
jgi:hypothetical protein